MTATSPRVGILMGSDSDYEIMVEAAQMLQEFNIPFEMTVSSAHRSPQRTAEYARTARQRGLQAIIVGAGAAAHLAGVVAAESTLPVIGVPIDSSALQGWDALLATAQMPAGIPVATMAIGKAGARNAGVFAAQIMSTSDAAIADKLKDYKEQLAQGVATKGEKLQQRLQADGLA